MAVLFGNLYYTLTNIIPLFSLNPKSYCAVDHATGSTKTGTKGVQKKTHLDFDDFKRVLAGEKKLVSVQSIQQSGNQMCSVKREKVGLSNVFLKAYVEEDNITVRPFTRFLKPVKE